MPMAELWALWDEHFPRRPAHHNRSYVESRLAYRIQEKTYGALPTPIRRMLVDAGAKYSKIKTATGRSAQTLLMPGTTLSPCPTITRTPATPAATWTGPRYAA